MEARLTPAETQTWPAPKRRRNRQWLEVLPFLLPGLLLIAVFVFYPLVKGIQVSFYHWNIMPGAEQEFVGLQNYTRVFHDRIAGMSVVNTLLYVAITVPGQMVLGMLVALAVNSKVPGQKFWRVVYYLPVIVSWVVVAAVFKFLFTSGSGPVNYLLKDLLHVIPENIKWLGDSRWVSQIPTNLLGIWKGIGWTMLMLLIGLQRVPVELYEAASIDGADARQTFWQITAPLVKPQILFVFVSLTIGGFQNFIGALLLNKNGDPVNTTHQILTLIFRAGFRDFDFGYGFALAVLLGLLIWLISFMQFKWLSGQSEI